MDAVTILILHLLLYGLPPFIIVKLVNTYKSMTFFYAYFGFLFVFTQLFAVFYSIKITNDLIITGGNIAYSSIILITFILAIVSQDPSVVRNLISIQIILNIFLFFLYLLLVAVLSDPATINIFGVSPEIFRTTIIVNVVSLTVFVIEVLIMFYLLEKVKYFIKNLFLIIVIYVWVYIGILCLDGFLFPFLISLFEPEFGQYIVGGVLGKFVLGIGFSPFLVVFLIIHKKSLKEYIEEPFPLIHVIIPPRKELVRKLEETENSLKESVRKYQEAYLRANFYKELFTHDIRNIIQNFSMSVDILKKHQQGEMSVDSGDIESLYKIMTKQIKRSKKLINNLQTLSNIESGEIELIPINLIEYLSNAIKFIQDSFSPKQIKIEVESFTDQVYINGNELLVNVIENILLNAISYNESKIPKILIKISMIKENKIRYIKTEFIDNGIGIPDIIKEKIFLKGYKEIKGKKGMGLGLSLVTKIIELFNGKIWVEDHVKGDYTQGSNFIFLIPEAMRNINI